MDYTTKYFELSGQLNCLAKTLGISSKELRETSGDYDDDEFRQVVSDILWDMGTCLENLDTDLNIVPIPQNHKKSTRVYHNNVVQFPGSVG